MNYWIVSWPLVGAGYESGFCGIDGDNRRLSEAAMGFASK
jgi:hypothetical protein